MKMKTLIALLLLTSNAFALVHAPDQYQKITSSRGVGPSEVSGIRNLREVIPGILYRSGANGDMKYGPLNDTSVTKLCKQGFDTYFYDYKRGQDHNVPCGTNQTSVRIRPSLVSSKNVFEQLSAVYTAITKDTGPVLTGCDQGVHASGFVSALSLIQFCGWTNKQALDYWTLIAKGQDNHPKIKKAIMDFRPYDSLNVSGVRCFKP